MANEHPSKCLHEEDWGKYKTEVDRVVDDIKEIKKDLEGNGGPGLKSQVTELMTLSREATKRTTIMIGIITVILMAVNIFFGLRNKPIPPQTIIMRGSQIDTISYGDPYYGPIKKDWNIYEYKTKEDEKQTESLLGFFSCH